MLLCQTHEKAAAISANFVLHLHAWPDAQLLDCPYGELNHITTRTTTNARTAAAANTSKLTADQHEIDKNVTNTSLKLHDTGDVGLLRLVQQGAAWDTHIATHSGTQNNQFVSYAADTTPKSST